MDSKTQLQALDLTLINGIEAAIKDGKPGDIVVRLDGYLREAVRTLGDEIESREATHTAQVLSQVIRVTLPTLTENLAKL